MKEVVGTIKRERNFEYKIDKDGNIIKHKYNLLRDPYTLVTLAIIILGGLYYLQVRDSATNAQNFDKYCMMYMDLRNDYVLNHPLEEVTFKKVLEYSKTKNPSELPNLSGGGNG